jgi:hypothetical protein
MTGQEISDTIVNFVLVVLVFLQVLGIATLGWEKWPKDHTWHMPWNDPTKQFATCSMEVLAAKANPRI